MEDDRLASGFITLWASGQDYSRPYYRRNISVSISTEKFLCRNTSVRVLSE